MASLTSLVSLGSACTCSSGQFEGSRSLVRRVSFSKDYCSFREVWIGRRWSYISICKFSVTTEVIADQGSANSVSIDSTYGIGSKEEDGDLTLRPSPRPVLKPKVEPAVGISLVGSGSWDGAKFGGGSVKGKLMGEEERSKVIESLGEVLEKVEKLESSTNASAPVAPVRRVVTPPNSGVEQRNGGPVGSRGVMKAKTIKSVWRKGNPVATVQKVVKEVPKIVKPVEDAPKTEIVGKVEAPPAAPLRPPQPPLRVQPMLRARPSVAPPPPVVRKPVILKDVGSAPKPAAIVETLEDEKTKERKPILIDKFASKKPAIDPLTSQAVAKPSKPGKTPAPGRFREDIRRTGGTLGGLRRRRLERDHHDDDLGTGRKGRKWSKASRKAARLQAAKEAEPVKAEILEVGEEGMLTEVLAFNLATNEAEILGFLYAKGIRLDGVQALDKDIVKMVCKEYEVEVIDAAPTRVEEMAKKERNF